MSRTVSIGIQDYAKLITNDYFYIDKTNFENTKTKIY